MGKPELWIIAGPNGAGKTTLTQQEPIRSLIPRALCLNPDDLTRQRIAQAGYATFVSAPIELLNREFIRAAEDTLEAARTRLRNGETVVLESVLSTDKYRPVVEDVLAAGGFFGLVYIALASPAIAQQRVQLRTLAGGHYVPPEKTASRWQRSLERLPWFARKAHRFFVLDNSVTPPRNLPRLIAEGTAGKIVFHEPLAIPELTRLLQSAGPA